MVYDLLFFFIVIIIVLNLIFGVIIDTFADLRSEKQKKEEILKTTCFICGEAGLRGEASVGPSSVLWPQGVLCRAGGLVTVCLSQNWGDQSLARVWSHRGSREGPRRPFL